MLREGRMVGGREASLVTALAGQASIAIENSRLLEHLDVKTRLLEESEAIHRRLTDAGLKQTGLNGLGDMLAELLGRGVTIEQDVVASFRRHHGGAASDTTVAQSAPIMAGGEKLGQVLVTGPAPLDELDSRTLEHGATVLAVELLKERTAQEVEWRLGGELLDELLSRTAPMDRRLKARAARFGFDAGDPHRIAVLETTEDDIDLRGMHLATARVLGPAPRAMLLASLGPGRVALATPRSIDDRLGPLLHVLAETVGHCAVGLSRLTTDLPRGLREALACARFATLSGRAEAVVRADDLGAMRFLITLDDPAPLHDYVDEQLGPLLRHGSVHDAQLIGTLRTFLATSSAP
ncbi:MAG TPA: hypothetical protein VHJ17_02300 [Thermomonospora sp.]|nr:hypothetical protein [Thermomonospora sp.]